MAGIFITQYFHLPNGAKTLTHIVLCTFLIKRNQIWSAFPENIRAATIKMQNKSPQMLFTCCFGMGSNRLSNSSPIFASSAFY